ncbi:hypothetical protein [Streptomyces sp. NPDC020480]|uniref:hypothetical protein n=1 Tax=Streptomyces sp. NPDC020480 TaxID=3365076 RepID=UPI0037A25131
MTTKDDDSSRELTFYDSYTPFLTGGDYTIKIDHSVSDSLGHALSSESDFPFDGQEFQVMAPRFALPPGSVHAVFPPPGATSDFDTQLAHVSLTRPILPWEQMLDEHVQSGQTDRIPWLALLLFAPGELPDTDPYAQGSVGTACTVQDLLDLNDIPNAPVLGPDIDKNSVLDAVKKTTCRTIDVPADVFKAVAPRIDELAYLTHVRDVTPQQTRRTGNSVRQDFKDLGRYGVVLANRFPRTPGPYAAHLVSLEGFADYLKPDAGAPKPLRLVSLHSWAFIQQPDAKGHFSDVVSHLAADPDPRHPGDPFRQSLRLPPPHDTVQSEQAIEASNRLTWGYTPVRHETATGESTFGWYRGPCSAVPVPPVPGLESESNDHASADGLLIYVKDWGVYDLSYAVAWSMGRLVALSHAESRIAVQRLWRQARITAFKALRRITTPAEVSGFDPGTLTTTAALARDRPAVHHFHQLLADGLPEQPTGPMAADAPSTSRTVRSPAGGRSAGARRTLDFLERSEARATLARSLDEHIEPAADVVEALRALEMIPFDHLVPDARMLPAESVRFFFIDQAWVTALVDGAMSTGVSTSQDQALAGIVTNAVAERLASREGGGPSAHAGMVMRSRLARDWPNLSIAVQDEDGAPVEMIRREMLAPDVMLCLFGDVPETVTFSEAHQDLTLGVEDADGYRIMLRNLGEGKDPVGEPIHQEFPSAGPGLETSYFRPMVPGARQAEVMDIAALIPDLGSALGTTVKAAGFAVQLFVSSVRQAFTQPR